MIKAALKWAAVAALAVVPGLVAKAAVNLQFTNPGPVTVARGASFPLTLNLISTGTGTADQVSGIDYFLQSGTPDVFSITHRNSTGSKLVTGTFYPSDTDVATAPDNVITTHGNQIRNNLDLGGSADKPYPAGNTYFLADYTIGVAANAPLGQYTLTTFPGSNTGYTDGSGGTDRPINQQASITVNVVAAPEPASLLLLPGLAIGALARRRARRTV